MRTQDAGPETGPLDARPLRATYRCLRAAGLSEREAGTLTGRLTGIRIVPAGWSIEEVERLVFARELVRRGRMGS